MAKAENCKKCGKLFIQASREEICPDCQKEQNLMLSNIVSFVLQSQEDVNVETILEDFNLTRSEFDALFLAGKFVKISNKIIMKCSRCGKEIIMGHRTNFLCDDCTRKLQNEI